MDRQLSKVASNIEIPQDFVKNDTMKTNSFDQMLIEKWMVKVLMMALI